MAPVSLACLHNNYIKNYEIMLRVRCALCARRSALLRTCQNEIQLKCEKKTLAKTESNGWVLFGLPLLWLSPLPARVNYAHDMGTGNDSEPQRFLNIFRTFSVEARGRVFL